MNTANTAVLLMVATAVGFAQSTPRPEFEVASIRPSAQGPQEGVAVGVHIDGAQVRYASLTLKDYIGIAYRTKVSEISGPDWISSDRFDISATVPTGVPVSQTPEMMQSLLEQRFHLKFHREKKDFPVYVLEIAKGGLRIQETAPDPNSQDVAEPVNIVAGGNAQGVSVNLGRGSSYTFADNKFEAKRISIPELAAQLERFVDRPIVDMTGLKGTYDLTLDVTPEDYRTMLIRAGANAGVSLPPQALRLLEGASLASLFDAMQRVGVKMVSRKEPLDVLVVEDARKTPTDN